MGALLVEDAGHRTFVIVGTAGHVDHGKTTLVRALTGVDTDRLPEEKARGISIDLGFAYASLAPDDGEPVGYIDVPGHRRFVQTMIAGAAGVDVGLLVVAADDGPMPQTREHVDILRWLGVPRLVVALSKVDRVDDARRTEAAHALDELLDATPYRGAPIVPVSAVRDIGLDALKAALLAHRHGRVDDARRFRLAIDRAFVLQGIGLVVTGTCFAGRVAVDDRLTLLPGGLEARVRTIHAQNRPVGVAHAGQRVALNLVGRGVEKSTVHRGDWIVDPALAFLTDRADVALRGGAATAALDERRWRGVRFHAGAASCNARVVSLASSGPDAVLAQIAFEAPLHLLAGDRFVLRAGDDGSATSVAGGVVLDVDVPARGRRSPARLDLLAVAADDDAERTLVHAIGASARGVDLAHWNRLHNTTFDADAVSRLIAIEGGRVDGDAEVLFSSARWSALLARVVDVLAAEHLRAPDAVGPGRDRLRRMATPSLDAATFATMLAALKADGRVVQSGAWLHLRGHRVELSADDRRRFDAVRALLAAAAPFNPPRVRDVATAIGDDEATIRLLFVRLASQGEVYRIAHDHYFLPDAVRALARIAADVAAADGVARAAAFRDRIGVGRKVAIQILEFFDRVGYTRRHGDEHRVIQPTLFED